MTVNTKDKSILFQMPVQISESGFQQSAFAIEASGTSQGDATEVPVGVSVVNITSKIPHTTMAYCLKQQWGSQYSFLRGDYKSTDGEYDFRIFPQAQDYINNLHIRTVSNAFSSCRRHLHSIRCS